MTPQQQRLLARYGTFDPAAIEKLKAAENQTRQVITQKGMVVTMTAEECQKACRAAGVEYLEGYEERVLQYVMSDETVDRQGDIMRMAGCNLKEFKKNRVILRMHDYREFPVGICLEIGVEGAQLKGKILFLDDRVDTEGTADRAFRFAKSGVMKACSIGFKGDEVRFPDNKEREDLGMKPYGVIFDKWTLMEVSVCPVPANANALAEAFKKGIFNKEDVDFVKEEDEELAAELEAKLKEPIPDPVPAPVPDPVADPDPELDPEAEAEKLAAALVTKAGRTISSKNKQKLQALHDNIRELNRTHRRGLQKCMDELKSLLGEDLEPEVDDEKSVEEKASADLGHVSDQIQLLKAKF